VAFTQGLWHAHSFFNNLLHKTIKCLEKFPSVFGRRLAFVDFCLQEEVGSYPYSIRVGRNQS
jgi:hypothetical protein